jgi:PAS domain S-box-containing protein
MKPPPTVQHARAKTSEAGHTASNILERVTDAFVALDSEWCYTYVNEKAARILGRPGEDLIGKHIWTEFPEGVGQPFYHAYLKAASEQIPVQFEEYYPPWDQWFVNNVYPSADGLSIFFQDITDRKKEEQERSRLEELLLESHKMQAIGRLAGGVAHDFNNLLTVILGNTRMVLNAIDDSPATPTDHLTVNAMQQVEIAGQRAAELTQKLMEFSKKQSLTTQSTDINKTVSDMMPMLTDLAKEHIHLQTRLQPGLAPFAADPRQIERVVLNLCINGRDAMPQGGDLTIETARVVLDDVYTTRHAEIPAGQYAQISIRDTGTGMTQEVISHIFEPFFTTKPVGQGTGLGLSTVYGIMRQTGGHIVVDSEPGQGTMFRLYFPVAQEAPDSTHEEEVHAIGLRGTETVLVCEDEPMVRRLVCRALKENGYTTIESENGRHALEVVHSYGQPIDALIADVVMPELNGTELALQLTQNHPNLRVIYISGYADDVLSQQGVSRDTMDLIQKPFHPDQVLQRLRRALDQGPMHTHRIT